MCIMYDICCIIYNTPDRPILQQYLLYFNIKGSTLNHLKDDLNIFRFEKEFQCSNRQLVDTVGYKANSQSVRVITILSRLEE